MNEKRHLFSRVFSLVSVIYVLVLALYLILRLVVGDRWWWLAFLNNFAPYYFLTLLIFFPMAVILRNRTNIVRLLPFVLIGLLWYGSYWLPKNTAVASGSESLKIVTFNVLPINPRLDDVVAWIREMNADVVLLQELAPHIKTRLREELADLYLYSDDLSDNQLTLSRHELLASESVELNVWWVQYLTLNINGQETAIYNVHLPMPTLTEPRFDRPVDNGLLQLALMYDETWRNAQIRVLLERIKNEPLPHIVAGDFNTSDNAIIYGEIAAVMRDSFREAGIGLGASWPAETGEEGLPSFLPALIRIDYVWHSEEFYTVSASTGPRLGSDHLPLIVSLGIKAT